MSANALTESSRLPARQASHPQVEWRQIAQILLLVISPCASYWPALDGTFLWDDDLLITKNPFVLAGSGLRYIWFSTGPYDYFPLTNTAFWLEWRLWGDDPLGYHVVNLALHVTSAFLLWRLLRALRVPGAWLGALLFAVHPINVASVAWIAELKNTLSMVFYLGSLLCYVRSDDGPVVSRGRYVAALGLHVLAVLSKSSVVMMPCVLLVLAWWRTGRVQRRDVIRTVPLFLISLAAGLATIWFQHHRAMSAASSAHVDPLPVRLIVAGRSVFFYLGHILWPQRLMMLYPHWEISPTDAAGFLWPAGAVCLLVTAWWGQRWWGRSPAAALVSVLLILLPVSGLVNMSFHQYSYVSDHFIYAATPGLLALAAAGLTGWCRQGGARGSIALVVTGGITGLLGLGCVQRADNYASSENLWQSDLKYDPNSAGAHNHLGMALEERGRRDPTLLPVAEGHFREALKTGGQLASAGVNLANLLRIEGRYAESAALYRQVLAVDPEAESFNNYGVALLELGDYTGARGAFRQAAKLQPDLEMVYFNLYRVELAEDHLADAHAMLRVCLQINPDSARPLAALRELDLKISGRSVPAPQDSSER